jgi:hypothetical protein
VRSNKSDVNNAVFVVDPNDKAVLVPCQIENYPAVVKNTGTSVLVLDFIGRCPVCLSHFMIPSHAWLYAIRMLGRVSPELLQRRQSDDSHRSNVVPFWDYCKLPYYEQKQTSTEQARVLMQLHLSVMTTDPISAMDLAPYRPTFLTVPFERGSALLLVVDLEGLLLWWRWEATVDACLKAWH